MAIPERQAAVKELDAAGLSPDSEITGGNFGNWVKCYESVFGTGGGPGRQVPRSTLKVASAGATFPPWESTNQP